MRNRWPCEQPATRIDGNRTLDGFRGSSRVGGGCPGSRGGLAAKCVVLQLTGRGHGPHRLFLDSILYVMSW